MVRNKVPLVQISLRGIWGKKVYHMSEDKNIAPLRVANLAAFLFYRYKVLVPIRRQELVPIAVKAKNMSRLPIR
ncbi:hypothetical protein J28TS4_15430 [Paenibacillus lautus]|nr:hypothetical protein J28TS4_15430 [Paenibacillus lautus]